MDNLPSLLPHSCAHISAHKNEAMIMVVCEDWAASHLQACLVIGYCNDSIFIVAASAAVYGVDKTSSY